MPTRPVDLAMYWHERTHHSQPHRWLRAQVLSVLSDRRADAAQLAEAAHA